MKAWKVNLLTVLALLALALAAVPVFSQKIQKDIDDRAHQYLVNERVSWVSASTDGRDLLLSGNAPDHDALQSVVDGLEALSGVRSVKTAETSVDVAMALEEPESVSKVEPELSIPNALLASFDGSDVRLNGTVADDETRFRLQEHAEQLFGADAVSSDWTVGGLSPSGWENAVKTGIAQLARLKSGELEMAEGDIRLSGEAELKAVSDSVNQQMQLLMEEGYSLAYQVDVELPSPQSCQDQFVGLLQGQSIQFSIGQSAILDESLPLLESLVEIAQQCTDHAIQVAGHTDASGGAARNQHLSYARAQAVVDWLAAQGVDVSQVTVVGHGERYPLASNKTRAGQAKNRRIEFTVKGS